MTEYVAADKELLKKWHEELITVKDYTGIFLYGIDDEMQKLIDSPPMQIDAWVTPENELLQDGDWHKGLYENCQPLYSIPKPKE